MQRKKHVPDSKKAYRMIKMRFLQGMMFMREWLRSPRAMGTICPSSRSLARAMAERVGHDSNGLVIELGAGTGCVTAALLKSGLLPERLLVIERSESMVALLRKKFPGINIVHGDAARLSSYIPEGKHVDCIVSSLPFASLDGETKSKIISEMKKSVIDGKILQFTYMLSSGHILARSGFTCVSATTVWKNLPPAKVMEFTTKYK